MLLTLRTVLAVSILTMPLVAQNTEPAPTPRFAGIYQPNVGFLTYEAQSPTKTEQQLEWRPQWPHTRTEGLIWNENNSEINGLELVYSSRHADPTGKGGNFLLVIESPQNSVREILLHGLPLGGAQGQLQSWRVIIELANGLELQTDTLQPTYWSLESDAPETGLCTTKQHDKKQPYLKALTQEEGFQSIYPHRPGLGDDLTLLVKKQDDEVYSFTIKGSRPEKKYVLFLANENKQEEIGASTLLLKKNSIFDRIPMNQGECTIMLPPQSSPIFLQALEFDNTISEMSLTGASQGFAHLKKVE